MGKTSIGQNGNSRNGSQNASNSLAAKGASRNEENPNLSKGSNSNQLSKPAAPVKQLNHGGGGGYSARKERQVAPLSARSR